MAVKMTSEKQDFWEQIRSRTDLSSAAKNIANTLLEHLNMTTGQCNPGRTTLSEKTGLADSTIKSQITILEDRKIIKVLSEGGGRTSSTYHFVGLNVPVWTNPKATHDGLRGPKYAPLNDASRGPKSDTQGAGNRYPGGRNPTPNKEKEIEKDKTIDRSVRENEKTDDHVAASQGDQTEFHNDPLDPVDDEAIQKALAHLSIERAGLSSRDLKPIHDLRAEGFDFERHLVPAITHLTNGLRTPLRSLHANKMQIREKARVIRDLASPPRPSKTDEKRPFVIEGSPQWRAWLRHFGKPSMPSFNRESDRTRRGNFFDSEWPWGWSQTRLEAAESERELLKIGNSGSSR